MDEWPKSQLEDDSETPGAAKNSKSAAGGVLGSHQHPTAPTPATSPAVGTSKTPPQHSESPVCTVEELFRAVDVDGSGDISFEELAKFWTGRQHALGKHDDATIAQMRSIFDDLDEDGSGAQCH